MMDLKGQIESEGSNSARTEGCKTDAQGPLSVLALTPAPYSHGSGGKLRVAGAVSRCSGTRSRSVRTLSGVTQCHEVSRDNVTLATSVTLRDYCVRLIASGQPQARPGQPRRLVRRG